MNCRDCGYQIPNKLLQGDSFRCPNCGKLYRRKNAQPVVVSSSKLPVKRYPHKKKASLFSKKRKLLRKRIWKSPVWVYALVLIVALMGSSGDTPESDVINTSVKMALPTASATEIATTVPITTPDPTEVPIPNETAVPVLSLVEPTTTIPATGNTLQTVVDTSDTPIALAEPEIPVEQQEIKKGDTGETVEALQKRLIALGYLSGKADGVFGNGTQDAIEAYQKDAGLPVTGVCDYDTYVSMTSSNAPRKPVEQTYTSSSSKTKEEKVWIATTSGKKYHNKGCRTLKNSPHLQELTISQAKSKGYTACKVCK